MMKLSTKQIALTSIFAGLYYLFSFLPGIPVPGLASLTILVGAAMATVFGYVLGPFLGAVATFLGVFVAWLLPPGNMALSGLFFIPSPVLNAVVSGLLFQRRWKAAAATLGVLIVAFWFTPPVQPITEFWNIGIAVTFDKIIAFLLIGLVILIDRRARRTRVEASQEMQRASKPWVAPSLFIISSLLVLGNNLLVGATGQVQNFQYGDLQITFGYDAIINAMGSLNYLWIAVGLISLFASIMFWLKPEKGRMWSITAMLASLASVLTGGGFIAGVTIAVVTGFFTFFSDVISSQAQPRLEVLLLFIMAFIGNEADNIWGSLIFAFPFVYETIFSLNVDVVRFLFLLSPFAYPAIRFLQAIIATFVAVPLIRTLRAAKFIPNLSGTTIETQQNQRGA